MRRFGGAGSARSPGLRGHAWCLHGDVAEYRRGLAGFFAESLQDGRRVAYVGSDDAEAARADLADLSDPDRLLAAGALHVLSARDVYGAGGPVDPERVVACVAAATEQALADGFRGLAVSADATELVGTPAHQDAFARWEFPVDGYIATHPLSGLCGYGLELGNDAVAEYVDHWLLLTLDACGRRNRIAASLRSAPPFVARLMELLPVVSLQLAKSGAQE